MNQKLYDSFRCNTYSSFNGRNVVFVIALAVLVKPCCYNQSIGFQTHCMPEPAATEGMVDEADAWVNGW